MADNLVFSADPARDLNDFLNRKQYARISVLADSHTVEYCYPIIAAALPEHQLITVEAGELQKNLSTCEKIWEAMTRQELDRHSVLIVIGGGVLGDMGGFCAATYKRGIDFVLIPTTLLAQVDASIGGKLGVDFHLFKNHIGVFQHPALTILHNGFLKTLPPREIRSGFAEIVKHVVTSDKAMWASMKYLPLGRQNLPELIEHSVAFKKSITLQDPKEQGLRKILNAGHTIGHAIETHLLSGSHDVLHGEAVAAGLVTEAWIAQSKGMLSQEELNELSGFIFAVYGKLKVAEHCAQIAALTTQDKKNKGGKILCVLLDGIGSAKWDIPITSEEIESALRWYQTA